MTAKGLELINLKLDFVCSFCLLFSQQYLLCNKLQTKVIQLMLQCVLSFSTEDYKWLNYSNKSHTAPCSSVFIFLIFMLFYHIQTSSGILFISALKLTFV